MCVGINLNSSKFIQKGHRGQKGSVYSQVSIIRSGRPRLLEFEKKIVLVV